MSETLKRVKETLSGASLSFHWWSPTRAGRPNEHMAAATALKATKSRRLKVRKEVIDTRHPAWRAVTSLKTAIVSWWNYVTLPYTVNGQRLFLRERRQEIWGKAAEFARELEYKVKALDAARDDLMYEALEALGDAFDESAYPARWSDVMQLETPREHSIEPPSYLAYTNAEEYRREMERTLSDLGQSMARFEQQCMAGLAEATARLAANLSEGGKVMGANVDAFHRVFARVAQMKFEGTQVFKTALEEARDVLEGVTADELRHKQGLKEQTRGRLQELMKRFHSLQGAVVAKHQEQPEPVPA